MTFKKTSDFEFNVLTRGSDCERIKFKARCAVIGCETFNNGFIFFFFIANKSLELN